jgi:PHP family Zn ribbon phosphoesterase
VKPVIGSASDFYRVRLARLDSTDGVDLEWRDDILYRDPPTSAIAESESWVVEAVELDDEDAVHTLATFPTSDEAHEWLNEVDLALGELTKSRFETRYLRPGESTETP